MAVSTNHFAFSDFALYDVYASLFTLPHVEFLVCLMVEIHYARRVGNATVSTRFVLSIQYESLNSLSANMILCLVVRLISLVMLLDVSLMVGFAFHRVFDRH